MSSQVAFSNVDYYSMYGNHDRQEGTWSQDSYFDIVTTQTPDSSQYPSSRGSPHDSEDSAAVAIDSPANFDGTGATPGYSPPPGTINYTMYPTGGILPSNWHGSTVLVYGHPLLPDFPSYPGPPPPSQENSRVVIPFVAYECGNTQKNWSPKEPILFYTNGRLGVKLSAALNGDFKGIDGRDDFPLDEKRSGITIRINFPGYYSSTHVEKVLKEADDGSGKSRARSMQLATKNYKSEPGPVNKSKLVQEVAKRVQWHMSDLENNSDLFPFDNQVEAKWRLGQGRMEFKHMVITALKQVSAGSWSPVICLE